MINESELPWTPAMEMMAEAVALLCLREEGKNPEAEVSLLLVDDKQIRALNGRYRKIDSATDVLSFPQEEERVLGDIVISLETAQRQAKAYGHSYEREIGFLIAHSMLHLMGYDHVTAAEEEAMCRKQERILEKAGLIR